MSRLSSSAKPKARVWLQLKAAEGSGMTFANLAAALPDVSKQDISQACDVLRKQGYARPNTSHTPRTWEVVPGVDLPMAPAGEDTAAEPDAAAGTTPELDYGVLAEAAAKHIAARPLGASTWEIAQALNCSLEAVDDALAPAVVDNKLICCGLVRGSVRMQQYRISAGGVAGYDWRKQRDATWLNRPDDVKRQMAANAQVLITATPAPAPAPAPAVVQSSPAPAPVAAPPAPAPVLKQPPAPPPAEVARDVVPLVEPPTSPAEAAVLRFLGDLDIDEVDRKVASAAGREAPGGFLCALHSNGVLMIEQAHQRLMLPLASTRKLLHYLDHLRGNELVDALAAEQPA